MDWNSEEGRNLAGRLDKELVIWLTTVRPNGMPTPTPVWFLWDRDTFLIYTQPGSAKMRSLAANTFASLNLNCDEWGGSVAVFTGRVEQPADEPPAIDNPAYLEKYHEGIADIQMTPESFSKEYSVALRFHVEKVRAW